MSARTQEPSGALLAAKIDKLELRIDRASILAGALAYVAEVADSDCGDSAKSGYWLLVIEAVSKQISSVLEGSLDRQEADIPEGKEADQ